MTKEEKEDLLQEIDKQMDQKELYNIYHDLLGIPTEQLDVLDLRELETILEAALLCIKIELQKHGITI